MAKMKGVFLGFPRIRIIVFACLYSGPLFWEIAICTTLGTYLWSAGSEGMEKTWKVSSFMGILQGLV